MSQGLAGLKLDPTQPPKAPVAAATVIVVRDTPGGLELFCVQRNPKSAFLGGAIVFPGGKLDPADRTVVERGHAVGEAVRSNLLGEPDEERVIAVAAARETLEEAGIVPTDAAPAAAAAVRAALRAGAAFPDALALHGVTLALDRLSAFARWVTPEAEPRRYDTRFYVLTLPEGQEASHDAHETTMGFWASPAEVLARFAAGDIQLAPPTTRTLELLCETPTSSAVLELASRQSLLPICPRFVPGDPPALVLPGDPSHEIPERRVAGPTRFVLRDGRFVSEDA
jgi:8-oxo-dGTP pyrophosphatase MutT (NUDIX family)